LRLRRGGCCCCFGRDPRLHLPPRREDHLFAPPLQQCLALILILTPCLARARCAAFRAGFSDS
jgi:hypothetical protein